MFQDKGFSDFNLDDLQAICDVLNLPSDGRKSDLKIRIKEYMRENNAVERNRVIKSRMHDVIQRERDNINARIRRREDEQFFRKLSFAGPRPKIHIIEPQKIKQSMEYNYNPFRKLDISNLLNEYTDNFTEDYKEKFQENHPDISLKKPADDETIAQIKEDLNLGDRSGYATNGGKNEYIVHFGNYVHEEKIMKYVLRKIMDKIKEIKDNSAFDDRWRIEISMYSGARKISLPLVNYNTGINFEDILAETITNYHEYSNIADHEAMYNALRAYEKNSNNDGTELAGLDINDLESIRIYKTVNTTGKNTINGGFFGYILNIPDGKYKKTAMDTLKDCQVCCDLKNIDKDIIRDNCFIYALYKGGVPMDIIDQMRIECRTYYVKPKYFHKLLEQYKVNVQIYKEQNNGRFMLCERILKNNNFLGAPTDDALYSVKMFWYKEHYLIYRTLEQNEIEMYKHYVGPILKHLTTAHLIVGMMKYAKKLTISEFELFTIPEYKRLDKNIENLEYKDMHIRKYQISEKNRCNNYLYFVIDFECTQDEAIHKPFCVCIKQFGISNNNQMKILKNSVIQTFIGEDCNVQMMDYFVNCAFRNRILKDGHYVKPIIVIYVHNLSYDMKFYAKFGIIGSINNGTNYYSFTQIYKDVTMISRDILKLLPYRLAEFQNIFNLDVHKDVMPYEFYTFERMKDPIRQISEVFQLEYKPRWNENKKKQFVENISVVEGVKDPIVFDMIKYAKYYCEKDVEVTTKGLICFYEMIRKELDVNIFDYLSISAIAKRVLEINVYSKCKELYEYGTHVKMFIDSGIYGGRTMCAYNKKWHVKEPLADFDAVSLYPSAMKRLKLQLGKPEPINFDKNIIRETPLEYKTYVIEIEIIDVRKHYPFPLLCQKGSKGNEWNDTVNVENMKEISEENPVRMILDNIYLEDLCTYSHIRYKALRGYVWNGDQEDILSDFVEDMFQKRLKYKKQKNPIQTVYKLILNSLYGKTIEKFHDTNIIYKRDVDVERKGRKYNPYSEFKRKHQILEEIPQDDGKILLRYNVKDDIKEKILENKEYIGISYTENEYKTYIGNNYQYILEDTQINDSNIHALKMLTPISNTFTLSLLGIQVLSMSKRIMNEVMCLAYDIGCKIYYQDTDSMHINIKDLERLVLEYKEKYGRELIGEGLGQFHSDFPTEGFDQMPHALESYFLMKKFYIDKLCVDGSDVVRYMYRCKGISNESMDNFVQRELDGNYMLVYEYLFSDSKNEMIFDLLDGKTRFKHNKDLTISTVKSFYRTVHCVNDEGDINKYHIHNQSL